MATTIGIVVRLPTAPEVPINAAIDGVASVASTVPATGDPTLYSRYFETMPSTTLAECSASAGALYECNGSRVLTFLAHELPFIARDIDTEATVAVRVRANLITRPDHAFLRSGQVGRGAQEETDTPAVTTCNDLRWLVSEIEKAVAYYGPSSTVVELGGCQSAPGTAEIGSADLWLDAYISVSSEHSMSLLRQQLRNRGMVVEEVGIDHRRR